MPRDPALAVALGAGHLGAAEAAGALHLDALGARLLGVLHRPLHGPAERDPAGELVGDALGDQGGVELGLLDLLDVELDLGVAGDLGQPAPEAVGLGAPAPDDDARAAVCTSIRRRSRVRSISTRLMAAWGSSLIR